MTRIQQEGVRLPPSPRENTNARFESLVTKAKVLAATPPGNDDYRQAKPSDPTPHETDYASLEAPGLLAADTIRYTTRDGDQVVVYRSSTPELYEHVVQDYFIREARAEGYVLSVDNGDTLGYYEHITEIDTRHADEGVITYKFGANQWVISKSHTPDTFERMLHMKQVLGFKEQGYALLGPEQSLPVSSTDYTRIEQLDGGLALVQTQDGKRYVVSEQLNASAYAQAQYQADVRAQIEEGQQRGYSVTTSLPSGFDIDKLTVESVDEKTGLIHFQYDGQKYMLPPGDASEARAPLPEGVRVGLAGGNARHPNLGTELYSLLVALKETKGTMAHQALVNAVKNGDTLARDVDKPAALNDIQGIHAYQEGGVQVVTLKDGSQIVVIEAMAPESFKAYAQLEQTRQTIARAEQDGFRLAGADQYLPSTEDITSVEPADKYGPGLIAFTYQKPGSEPEKIIVSAEISPDLFAQVSGYREEKNLELNDLDALRREHGLPPLSELNLNELPTTEKGEDGETLTVQELALKRMIDEYREGVENGSIGKDDPRAKFLRAIEAKSMAENGMSIIPEHGRGYKADADDPITVNSRDVREEIFDVQAIDEALAELVQNETVAADLARFDREAMEKVEGGPQKVEEVKQKIISSANSEAFRTYIKALEADGKGELAQLEIQQTYLSLAQIDPQLADQFVGDLSRDTMIMDLDALMADPSKISEDNSALAAIDTTNYWLRAARAIPDIPAHLISSWENTVQKFMLNKADAAAFSRIYEELGDTYFRNGVITDNDIQRLFASEKNVFQSLSTTERDNLTRMFTTMKDTGTLGSMSGLFGLARGVYQLHGNPGNLAGSSEGRLAIAADFITFASFSNGFLTLGSKTYDTILKSKVYDSLGLSKTIPEMWGAGKVPPAANPDIESDLSRHLARQEFMKETPNVYIPDAKGGNAAVVPKDLAAHYNPDAFTRGYLNGAGNTKYRVPTASLGYRIAGSVSRFVGSSADLAGAVTGIVLSAFSIRDGLRNGDSLQTASGFIGVVGGLSGVVAGIGSVNGAWGLIGGGLGRVIAAAGPVGFLISAGLGFVGAILGTIKSKKLHKISLQKWEQIKEFEKDGLLKENGASNYVWLQTYLANYRQRDAPDNRSIFEFRRDEWRDGNTTHHDYIGDGPNEISEGFKFSNRDRTFIDDDKNERQYTTHGYGGDYRPVDEPWP